MLKLPRYYRSINFWTYQSGPGMGLFFKNIQTSLVLGLDFWNFHTSLVLVLVLRQVDLESWYWYQAGKYLVLPQFSYEIGNGIKLVLPQVTPNWYIFQYQYSILSLLPVYSSNTGLYSLPLLFCYESKMDRSAEMVCHIRFGRCRRVILLCKGLASSSSLARWGSR